MNDNFWDRVRGLGNEIWKGANEISFGVAETPQRNSHALFEVIVYKPGTQDL